MCDNADDDSLALLKLIPDWFLAIKMFKKLFTALYGDENILYVNEDSINDSINWRFNVNNAASQKMTEFFACQKMRKKKNVCR